MPVFVDMWFELLSKLRPVFYAAGNVKGFAHPLIKRDILQVSAWEQGKTLRYQVTRDVNDGLRVRSPPFANRHFHTTPDP